MQIREQEDKPEKKEKLQNKEWNKRWYFHANIQTLTDKKKTHNDGNIETVHQWSPVLCLCHNPCNTRWNTNTHHHSISGSAGSAASPLALLTNRYSNNHLPSVLSGRQPSNQLTDPSSCLRPPFPLILGALRSGAASIH